MSHRSWNFLKEVSLLWAKYLFALRMEGFYLLRQLQLTNYDNYNQLWQLFLFYKCYWLCPCLSLRSLWLSVFQQYSPDKIYLDGYNIVYQNFSANLQRLCSCLFFFLQTPKKISRGIYHQSHFQEVGYR